MKRILLLTFLFLIYTVSFAQRLANDRQIRLEGYTLMDKYDSTLLGEPLEFHFHEVRGIDKNGKYFEATNLACYVAFEDRKLAISLRPSTSVELMKPYFFNKAESKVAYMDYMKFKLKEKRTKKAGWAFIGIGAGLGLIALLQVTPGTDNSKIVPLASVAASCSIATIICIVRFKLLQDDSLIKLKLAADAYNEKK